MSDIHLDFETDDKGDARINGRRWSPLGDETSYGVADHSTRMAGIDFSTIEERVLAMRHDLHELAGLYAVSPMKERYEATYEALKKVRPEVAMLIAPTMRPGKMIEAAMEQERRLAGVRAHTIIVDDPYSDPMSKTAGWPDWIVKTLGETLEPAPEPEEQPLFMNRHERRKAEAKRKKK